MRLRELIFQDVLGSGGARRLRPDGALARVELPPGVTVQQVQDLIVACLYPTQLTQRHHQRLQFGDSAKLAVVLEVGDRNYRIIRRTGADTVRLQRQTADGYDDRATGAQTVENALQQKLNLPKLPVFLPLHMWRFEPGEFVGSGGVGGDDRIPELIDQYQTALEVEQFEDQIKQLQRRIEESKQALGQGQKIEEKIDRARQKLAEIALDEFTDEDLEFLDQKDDRLHDIDAELQRLRDQEHKELDRIQQLLPPPLHHAPILWVGVAVAVLALGLSFAAYDTHRIVALGAVPGWAAVAFELFRYFHNRGRANLRKVRLTSIRRRINQVLEEEVQIRERVEHMLYRADVDDEGELRERLPEADRLKRGIAKLEEKLESVRRDPEYRRARKQLEQLQDQLQKLRQRREQMPELTLNSFQLEQDLEELGVDTDRLDADGGQGDDGWDFDSPFGWLQKVAVDLGQWNDDGLASGTRTTWSKICGHVLSDRFSDVELNPEGELQVEALTPEQLELWENTRTAEVRAVVAALALALHIKSCANGDSRALTSVWIAEPSETMTPGHADKFESVFKSAAKKSQIVICESTS